MENQKVPTHRARLQGVLGLAVLLVSSAGMVLRLEPFATWYYALAWWPFIMILDALVLWRQGHSLLWRNPREFMFLALLSVPVWLLFEALNLALQNWYYVGSSPSWVARWVGYTICFATVLPAILEAMELMKAVGVIPEVRVPPIRLGKLLLLSLGVAGLVCMLLPLVLPRYGFPLVWLGLIFLLEPINRKWGQGSLLAEWERGSITTALRLLAGGLVCGLAWEFFNVRALCKWIYTVPFLEELKLFEMPLLGFLGFPFFALECHALVQFVQGVRRRLRSQAARWSLVGLTSLGSLTMFHLVDLHTVNSLHPLVQDLKDLAPQEALVLEQAGVKRLDLWLLKPGARARESLVLELLGASPQVVARWRSLAAMATLKGMGTGNLRLMLEAGVSTLSELARQEPEPLARKLREIQQSKAWARQPPRDAQVRLWIREARRVCSEEPALPGCK